MTPTSVVRRLRWVLALALVAGVLAISPGALAADGDGVVSGTVTEAGAGTPVGGVRVTLECEYVEDAGTEYEYSYWGWCEDASGEPAGQTTTGPDGSYSLTVVPGTYRLWFDTDEVDDEGDSTNGPYASHESGTVTVTAGGTTSGVDAALTRRGSLSGTVQAAGGAPLGGVLVCAYLHDSDDDWYCEASTRTSPTGAYRLYVAPGEYRVRFSHDAWKTRFYDGADTLAQAQTLTVAGSAGLTGIDATLSLRGSIRGHVQAAGGTPLEGVEVRAYRRYVEEYDGETYSYWDYDGNVVTDDQGDYTLGVDAGEWRVGFFDPAWKPEYYDDATTVEDGQTLTVADGVATSAIDATLAPRGAIEGSVTNVEGQQLEDILVRAYGDEDSEWESSFSTYTDSDGNYRLPVDDGTWRVGFSDDDGTHATEFYDDAAILDEGADLTVADAATVPGIDAVLGPAARISGTVTDHDGTAVRWADVAVYQLRPDGAWNWVTDDSTDAAGAYAVGGLAPGTYRVRFSDYDTNPERIRWFGGGSTLESATDIVLEAGEAFTADQAFTLGTGIAGTVTGADGSPLSGVDVTLYYRYTSGSYSYWAYTDSRTTGADGRYAFGNLAAGTPYRLQYQPQGAGDTVSEYYDDAASQDTATTIVPVLDEVTTADAVLDTGGSITGTVTGADGQALSGVYVTAYRFGANESWTTERSATTDESGGYTVRGLRAGSYRLYFQPQGGVHHDTYFGGTTDFYESGTLSVVVGQSTSADQQLALAGSISGTITAADGTPLSDVIAHASPVESGTGRSAYTDAAGHYTIDGLAPGDYRLQFTPPYDTAYLDEYYDNVRSWEDAATLTVTSGGSTTADAALGTGGTISGTVTDGDGNPASDAWISVYDESGAQVANAYVLNDGTYSVNVLPGTYRVGFNGYVDGVHLDEYHPAATTLADATPVEVADGATVTIDHQLGVPGTISGLVTSAGGEPLADVRVLVGTGSSDDYRSFLVTTGTDGRYSVSLAPGTYWLTFESTDGRYEDGTADAVAVTAGTTVTVDNALTMQYGRITGTLTGLDDGPVANVWVYAYRQTGADSWTYATATSTDSGGAYVLGKLAAGSYRVRFDTSNEDFHTGEYFDDTQDAASASPITVAVGDSATADAALAATGGVVAGTITLPGSQASTGTYGYAYLYREMGDGEWSHAHTASFYRSTGQTTASYRFRHVEPGSYRLHVVPDDGTHVERYYPASSTLADGSDVEVTIGHVTTADVTTPVGASISGSVTGTDGAPAVSLYAHVHRVDPLTGIDTYVGGDYTDAQGSYRVGGLPAGMYVVQFSSTSVHVGEYFDDAATQAEAHRFSLTLGDSVTADAELDLQLANTSAPTITGELRVGEELSADPGTWTYPDATFTYRWIRGSSYIWGATSPTYATVAADLNQQIRVEVTASRLRHNDRAAQSAAVGPIDYGVIANPTPPAISGTARVGETLSVSAGTWKPSSPSLTYQWLRDGEPIEGATATTYRLGAADLDGRISVRVDAAQTGYHPTTVTTTPTDQVGLGVIDNLSPPTIEGTPRAGETLTASSDRWLAAGFTEQQSQVDVAYQWLRDGTPIAGATGQTHQLTVDDATHRISVVATATKAGYAPTEAISGASEKVTYGLVANTAAATVKGTPQVGKALSVDLGDWNTTGIDFWYTWLRDDGTTLGSGATYTPGPDDIDHLVSVRVRGTKPDWDPGETTTGQVGPVLVGQFDNRTAPSIAGTSQVGVALEVSTGDWEPSPADTTYRWLSDGEPIADATTSRFTPGAEHVGTTISVEMTLSRSGYESTTATAATSAPVAPGVIVNEQRPVISGPTRVGETLTTDGGSWDLDDVDLGYQWRRDGEAIADATGPSYVLVPADAQAAISVVVTAAKAGYAPTSRASVATDPITYDVVHNVTPPTVSGDATVGETLVATAGEWDQDDVAVTWQWLRDGEVVAGATGPSRTLVAADLGTRISVRATAAKATYDSGSADSGETDAVVEGYLANTALPAVSGSVRVGETLSATRGGWSPEPTAFGYEWLRDGTPVDGATSSTYTLTESDLGARLSVTVTASSDGYHPATATSEPTGAVAGPNHAPVLTVDISPTTTGAAPFDVGLLFGATDDDGDTLSYKVEYGDGSPVMTGSQPPVTPLPHTYGQPGTYQLKVSVTDGIRTVARTTTISAVLPEPVAANAGDDQVAVEGEAVAFDGSGSRPVGMIASYHWDFGDGTTGSGPRPSHTYGAPGDYVVTLTAEVAGESSTDEAAVSVTAEPPFEGIVATVTGAGAVPLASATVLLINGDGSRLTARSDADGEARLRGLDDGQYTVFAVADGFRPGQAVAEVSGGSAEVTIELEEGPAATAEVSTERMTPEQIEAVGIDPADPANQNVVEFEIHLPFRPTGEAPPPVTGVANSSGFIGCPAIDGIQVTCGGGWGGGGGGGGACTCTGSFSAGGYDYEFWGTSEYLVWLVIPGRASWLKEFFDVSLMVTNLSEGADFVLTDGAASLELPSGLALAPTSFAQSTTADFPDIPAGESRTIHWYVRGDVEGEYPIKASYAGFLQPFDLPINITALAKNPIKVWGGSAFKLKVHADKYVTRDHPYHVRVGIENVADVPMYNVTLELLTGGAQLNYIYQPREQLAHTKAVVAAGETLEYDYILVPRITGTLVLDKAFVAYTTGLELDSAVITQNDVERDRPDIEPAALNHKVGLIFENVPGSSDLQVFSTPDEATEFPAESEGVTWVRDTADGRKRGFVSDVDPADERYFAVSPIVAAKPEMSHAMVLARSNSLPSSVIAGASYSTKSGQPHSCGETGPFAATVSASDDFGLEWVEYEVTDATGTHPVERVVVPADADDTAFAKEISVELVDGSTVSIRVRAKNLAGDVGEWTGPITLDQLCPVHRAVVLAAGLTSSLDDNSSVVTGSDCALDGDERDGWNKTWAANACDESGSKGYGPGAGVKGNVLAQLEDAGYDPGQARGSFFRDVLEFSYTGAISDGQNGQCWFIPQDYAAWNTVVELTEVGTRMTEAANEFYDELVKYSNCWREQRGEILDFAFVGHSEGGYESLALARIAAGKAQNDDPTDDVRVSGVLTVDGAVHGATILTQFALQDCALPLVGIPRDVIKASMAVNSVTVPTVVAAATRGQTLQLMLADQLAAAADIATIRANGTYVMNVTNAYDGCLKSQATISGAASDSHIYEVWGDGWSGINAHGALNKQRVDPAGPDAGYPLVEVVGGVSPAPLPRILGHGPDLLGADGRPLPPEPTARSGGSARSRAAAPETATAPAGVGASLRVLVGDDTGQPLPHTQAALVDALGNVRSIAVSDDAGWLELAADPGDYALVTAADGYQGGERQITLDEGANVDVTVSLAPGAVITSVLKDAAGAPKPNAIAALYDGNTLVAATFTDGSGRAVFVVPPDKYGLRYFDPVQDDEVGPGALPVTPEIGNPAAGEITYLVGSPLPPTITSGAPPATATVGTPYAFQVTATGSPQLSVVGDLPPGLSLSAAGLLGGTPSAAGVFEFKIRATNAGGAVDSSTYAVTVAEGPDGGTPAPTITSAAPPATAQCGVPYTFQVTGTGDPTYSVQGSLPPGLTLSPNGLLSGSPTSAGTYDFGVRAANAGGHVDSPAYRIVVSAPPGSPGPKQFTTTVLPRLKGKARVGAKLRVTHPAGLPAGWTATYVWLRNGKTIKGAKKAAYKVSRSDRGKQLSVRIVYTASAYLPWTVTTAGSKKVR
ncbi:carboxypeptidase regulatory-like domain-containing protein [Nocardioides daeguensis]|uniref:PKD domain-containing protein n=1 Tax=Nocardioides daeguensis TaxID=908359 RepID=A0ABP6VQ36_9ACTN|nr:carboxypeptidase regulatory-like domain-containing protein [Nocardioides daeguensis]MBV6727502.1 carboxypeptidase regulatory-like domain-containing protein [Nocardioides daeguensis]MCR1773276.1 carboxypeptidase regulatory-like domain-containing protein [Nocardioides daeguensis]